MSKQNALTEPVYYILLSLLTPMHGYGIMQNVKKLTNDRVNIGAGTLYGAINTLLSKGFIAEYKSDPSKKEYIITDDGRRGAYKTKGACKKRRRIIGGLIRWIIHTSQNLNCFFRSIRSLRISIR